VERLLDACRMDEPLRLRDRALLELLYSTGARISEAVGLDLDDVDLAERSVLLSGKGGKQRLVRSVAPRCRAGGLPGALTGRVWPARAGNSRRLFPERPGGRLSRQSAWQALRHGRPSGPGSPSRYPPHTLRHSFGHPPAGGRRRRAVVQELLGPRR